MSDKKLQFALTQEQAALMAAAIGAYHKLLRDVLPGDAEGPKLTLAAGREFMRQCEAQKFDAKAYVERQAFLAYRAATGSAREKQN